MSSMNIVDRRLNPKGKSLGNRQRFFRRAKSQIQRAVRTASSGRKITDVESGDRISIPADGLREPTFHKDAGTGARDVIIPGNKEFVVGDKIARPPTGGGDGGSEGSPDGEGQDDFVFVLSRDEFLDLFLEDLELPDLVKRRVKYAESYYPQRAGFSVSGSPNNLNLVRTMRNSLSRRIALRRPRPDDLAQVADAIRALEQAPEGRDAERLAELREEYERLLLRSRRVPYIDPIDVRYNRFEQVPRPVTQAVMFCLMDVSGSMTEHMKDLAKRFFMLLYLFLTRRYRHVDIVFIRHTHVAHEVDEDTFFYSTETGGTVVSTALNEMRRIVAERYPSDEWNIYGAQASDGDNTTYDNARSAALLEQIILPVCQYFAYIEVGGEHRDWSGRETELWRTYRSVADPHGILAMRKVRTRGDIFPVFRDLFKPEHAEA